MRPSAVNVLWLLTASLGIVSIKNCLHSIHSAHDFILRNVLQDFYSRRQHILHLLLLHSQTDGEIRHRLQSQQENLAHMAHTRKKSTKMCFAAPNSSVQKNTTALYTSIRCQAAVNVPSVKSGTPPDRVASQHQSPRLRRQLSRQGHLQRNVHQRQAWYPRLRQVHLPHSLILQYPR
jgi:hypothetical protein